MAQAAERTEKKRFACKNRRVNTPTVLQMEALECGAASLAMILGYYGAFIPLERLRVECGVSRDGSKASKLLQAARRFGLNADGYKRDMDTLGQISLPAIIFWNFNHFVVLEGFKGGKAYLNDPASGKRAVSYDEFDRSFTGVALEFSKSEAFVKQGKKPSAVCAFKKRAEGLETALVHLILIGLFLLVPGFAVPAFSRFFVDSILTARLTGFLKPLLVAMGAAAAVQGALTFLQQHYLIRFQLKLSLSSSAKFLNHLFKMPADFFVQRMPGELCNRIQANDTAALLISSQLTGAAVNLFCALFYAALMFAYDVPLALLSVAAAAFNLLLMKLCSEKTKTCALKAQMELGKLYGRTMDGISMIETIKASGLENDFFQKWSGQQAKVVLENQKTGRLSHLMSQASQSIAAVLNLLTLSVGALRVMNGDLTIGMLAAFQGLQANFINPAIRFLQLGKQLQSGQADMRRLDDVMDFPAEKRYKDDYEPAGQDTPVQKLQGYVSLKNVTFGYSRLEPPLIENLNLELKPGMRVALVGSSGSGKSTIAKLVSALYKPWSGEILFDGKPISEIERAQFSSSLAVVDQDIFLFEGTVRDNLTMWNAPRDGEAAYIQAAKDARIHDVIAARPGGYFGAVEEGGRNFSGGERQRLEIARALVGNPRILILDEATSALDPVTEQLVDENIRRRGCACIIIAHRLSSIRDSDEILALDGGKIVQRGTHEELLKQGGLYRELIRAM